MGERAEEALARELGVGGELADAVESHEHDAAVLRLVHQCACVHRAEEAVEDRLQLVEACRARRRIEPALVAQPLAVAVRFEPVQQQGPLTVGALAEQLEADEAGVALPDAAVALAAGALTVACSLDERPVRHVHRHHVVLHERDAFLQRHVHETALAGGVAPREREQDASSRVRRALVVREALAHAVGRVLREAHAVHQAARCLGHEVGRLPVRTGTASAEAGDARVDEAGVHGVQGGVVERGGRLVLDEHVRRRHEPLERVVPLGGPAVKHDALPAPVEVEEVQAHGRVGAQERRKAALVRTARRFDVEHVGAEVGEEFRAVRAALARQGDDADAVERGHEVRTPVSPCSA